MSAVYDSAESAVCVSLNEPKVNLGFAYAHCSIQLLMFEITKYSIQNWSRYSRYGAAQAKKLRMHVRPTRQMHLRPILCTCISVTLACI